MKIKKFNESENIDNYMFFSNLENIVKMANTILTMDKKEIDDMLTNRHDWASDHVSKSSEMLSHVFDWLNSENK
jgi:hypothetical protein